MDAATLDTLKSELRRLVPQSIGDAMAELKKHLPDFSSKYNALLLIESRLNDANLKNIQNLLSDDALQIEYNQIRADLLLFISSLEVQDFELPQGAAGGKSGSLLYKIPEHMQLQQETKCIVRLAFDQASIIRNIELNKDVTIKEVRVAEVMQVELIDPSEQHPFVIRTISDEEQFVEKGDYSEWIFYVKPIIAGTFPLILKISVIEVIQGKERLRNITWEEEIQITASAPAEQPDTFKPTGIAVGAVAATEKATAPPQAPPIDTLLDAPSGGGAVPPPPAPVVLPAENREIPYAPAPQPAFKKRSNRGWMAAAASVLIIATVAIFMLPNHSQNPGDENKIYPITTADSTTTEMLHDSMMLDSQSHIDKKN